VSGDLIEVKGLQTTFFAEMEPTQAVRDISFSVKPREILALVGESGCGKSVTALSILRLVSPPGKITAGQIIFDEMDLIQIPENEMQKVRGNRIAMIFQEPMTSLNPVMKIGDQIGESLVLHKGLSRTQARIKSIELLKAVRMSDAEGIVAQYPHQLSGGMRQRVMIAMGIACKPALLIADEPTTALDVTIQAQILELLKGLRDEYGLAIILITHALGVVAEVADRVLVMYAGRIVEQAPVRELFANPRHPYTVGLLESIPKIEGPRLKRLRAIDGTVPDLAHLPAGCAFYDRCKDRMDICTSQIPADVRINPTHTAACYKY
jgi:oligopeptide/dipeptide ABC transporter ATP-binding protein